MSLANPSNDPAIRRALSAWENARKRRDWEAVTQAAAKLLRRGIIVHGHEADALAPGIRITLRRGAQTITLSQKGRR